MQSLGLVVLHVGTLAIKDKYYTYGGKDEIRLNEEVVMRRLKGNSSGLFRISQTIFQENCENAGSSSRRKIDNSSKQQS
mgnify:FL=1